MAAIPVLRKAVGFPPLRRSELDGSGGPPRDELIVRGLRVVREGGGPVVLLVGGPGAGVDAIDPRLLVRAGYEAVRWEARVGFVGDLADDAIAVLDAVGARDAHVVGDPAVARHVTLRAPERVRSITLVGGAAADADGLAAPALLLAGDEQPD
ncbi:MAG TPA: hypothetical protein VHB30_11245, partial [Solirubrobacteraceae bacterium]|nr:hypothetical protein [Solirubrobacteraceae bacterium]